MRGRWWLVVGTTLLVGGLLVSHAGQPATYKGHKACVLCHRNTEKELVASYLQSPHAFALLDASEDTVVADFADAPFERERVRYVLGKGRRSQSFMDENWRVLPGKWSVVESRWLPEEEVDGRKECVACHVTGFVADRLGEQDKPWKEAQVACEACHGPGSRHLVNPKGDTILKLKALHEEDPHRAAMVCGQCHSRGHDPSGEYPFATDFLPGDDLSPHFIDATPTEPGMNQQFSELLQSPKHWDQGVTCITCHEPHGRTNQSNMLRRPINDLCLGCHRDTVSDLPTHAQDKGVQAPGGATCATCHMPEGRHLFDQSRVPRG